MINIKQQSTGNNDSIEDIAIAIMSLKTEDGKLVSRLEAWKVVREFFDKIYLKGELHD